jgi:undecaprenyl-diphosphatase
MNLRFRTIALALPPTLVVVSVAGVLALADAAREHDGASRIDPQVASDVLDIRSQLLTRAAQVLTFLGSEPVVGALVLVLAIVLLERRGPFFAAAAAVAMAASAALTVGVKLAVERGRPPAVDRLGAVDSSYSFPSGHALNSAMLLGLVVVLAGPIIDGRFRRAAMVIAAVLLALGIGASRVYLGYHWTTDILASWLIATSLLAVVHLGMQVVERRRT